MDRRSAAWVFRLAADGPEFQRQARELAGQVHGNPARVLELAPEVMCLIQLEVRETGVERDLSRRDRQRMHRHAGQLQVDEIANLLYGADFELRREALTQLLGRQVGSRGQDKYRGAVKASIGD